MQQKPSDNLLPAEAVQRLQEAPIAWIATVRPNNRPHLVPVWFVFVDGKLYSCIEARSVKGRNLAANPHISMALEEGKHPIICEGRACFLQKPWPPTVIQAFLSKYEWDIDSEERYNALVQVTPDKWMKW
ncbi:MAG TPA: pyridoxamine 5'-phosphate oxidase family protein [Acidobacteriota bacterium]|nr:pyridoxamine 5'-phosphate oxidase family protein [Acidobacteriota bacterium]